MEKIKRQWLCRILTGALAGVAAHVLLGYVLGSFSLFGPARFTGFVFPYCGFPREIEWLGVLLSFALFALFGAEAGVATLPFADSGRELVVRSLVHYMVTAATVCLWAGLNVCSAPADYLTFLVPLTLVYLIVWLGRWVGWYAEVAAIREKLGLAPGPSPLHWRESLPYVGFAAFLCLALPLALRLLEDPTPLLSVLYGWLLLPVGGFMSGLSLGRRHGFCPIYPAACVVFILIFIPLARLFSNISDVELIPIALVCVLAGNLAGAARRRVKRRGETAR
ncbi:MAG: DUF3021 family protein [Oscillospiraceae bacterium]|jgi:hypothetical protein|nr:DUF3021 family protein [Oscillospiraceae bacterium]